MRSLLEAQPLVVGAVLVWAGGFKLLSRQSRAVVTRSALPRLVGAGRAQPVYRAVGGAELIAGAALLLPPVWAAEAVAAIVLTTGFLAYLGYSRVTAPSASCGCMGTQSSPVGVRTFARAGLLLLASGASLPAAATGLHWSVPIELMLVAVLSPEWDGYWLMPLRRWKVRVTHPLRRRTDEIPLTVTVAQLQRSGVYGQISRLITSDVRDHWDEGGWRIVCYGARLRGEEVSAVFAVPRTRFEPGAVRAALVAESTGATVLSLDPVPDPVAEAGWPRSRDLLPLI